MGKEKIFCRDCCHWDGAIFCKKRGQFVKPQKGKYCQDFEERGIKQPDDPKLLVLDEGKSIEPESIVKMSEERTAGMVETESLKEPVKKKVPFIKRIIRWKSPKD